MRYEKILRVSPKFHKKFMKDKLDMESQQGKKLTTVKFSEIICENERKKKVWDKEDYNLF